MANLRQCGLAETAENIRNAPDAEADDQYAHHHGHNGLAEPV
jgi:hypothetical protein